MKKEKTESDVWPEVAGSAKHWTSMEEKKVGNACRTKNQIRHSKSSGSAFEMDCEASLQQIYSDCFRTHERGYISQYDLRSDLGKIVVECKRLKAMSWNQAKAFWQKLITVKPTNYEPFLIFQSNHQPTLVMWLNGVTGKLAVNEFQDCFGVKFIKHKPTRRGE